MVIAGATVGLNGKNHSWPNPGIGQCCLEILPQGLPGTLAQGAQQLAVVFEITAQHFWESEDILAVGNRLENLLCRPLGKRQHSLLVAGGAEVPPLAGEGQKVFMCAPAAAHAGKATMQVSAVQILVNDLADDRAPEAILLLVGIVINALEVVKMILDERIQRGVARISGVIGFLG